MTEVLSGENVGVDLAGAASRGDGGAIPRSSSYVFPPVLVPFEQAPLIGGCFYSGVRFPTFTFWYLGSFRRDLTMYT